jgi:hypothetical protein
MITTLKKDFDNIKKDFDNIKKDFEQMKLIRGNIRRTFTDTEEKIQILKNMYLDIITTHQDNVYIYGIDSFHFQNKTIENEYSYMNKVFISIDNRMYCEYYKLYQMIQDYIKKEITDQKFVEMVLMKKKYPVYKDLELSKNYDFNITAELHQTILHTINELNDFLLNNVSKLEEINKQYAMGLYIDNMVNNINYNNAILVERINMFNRFMDASNKHHTKYFTRLLNKSKTMIDVINEDIHIKTTSTSVVAIAHKEIAPAIAPAITLTIAPAKIAFAPAKIAFAPAEIAFAPAEIAIAPAEIALAPAEIALAPAEIEIAPAEIAFAPAEIELAPAEIAIAPAEIAIAPAEIAIAPAVIASEEFFVTTV